MTMNFIVKYVLVTLQRCLIFIEYWLDLLNYRIFGLGDLEEEHVDGKVALVTGANTGLGKEIAKELAKRGATVILACRNMVAGEHAVQDIKKEVPAANLKLMELDLSDLESVRKFAANVKSHFEQINYTILNAGVCLYKEELFKTKQGLEMHMGVNHVGHFLLTNLLMDNIRAGAPGRVVVISSTTMLASNLRLDDLNMERFKHPCIFTGMSRMPYNNSKMANALFAKELGRRLDGTGITVYSLCPGIVRTDVFRDNSSTLLSQIMTSFLIYIGGLSISQAMDGILYCVLSRKCEHDGTGKFYRFGDILKRANRAMKVKDGEELWSLSERLVKSK